MTLLLLYPSPGFLSIMFSDVWKNKIELNPGPKSYSRLYFSVGGSSVSSIIQIHK